MRTIDWDKEVGKILPAIKVRRSERTIEKVVHHTSCAPLDVFVREGRRRQHVARLGLQARVGIENEKPLSQRLGEVVVGVVDRVFVALAGDECRVIDPV